MMPITLAPFDPSRDFEARTFFRAGGVLYKNGVPFDKSTVNDRVHRQLYEQRKIAYADGQQPGKRWNPKNEKRIGKLLAGFAASVLAHTRRASMPDEKGAAGPEERAAPDQTAEPVEDAVVASSPGEDEVAAATEGDAVTAAAVPTREELVTQLMVDHSLNQLLDLAKEAGTENFPAKVTKQMVAEVLVDSRQAE